MNTVLHQVVGVIFICTNGKNSAPTLINMFLVLIKTAQLYLQKWQRGISIWKRHGECCVRIIHSHNYTTGVLLLQENQVNLTQVIYLIKYPPFSLSCKTSYSAWKVHWSAPPGCRASLRVVRPIQLFCARITLRVMPSSHQLELSTHQNNLCFI